MNTTSEYQNTCQSDPFSFSKSQDLIPTPRSCLRGSRAEASRTLSKVPDDLAIPIKDLKDETTQSSEKPAVHFALDSADRYSQALYKVSRGIEEYTSYLSLLSDCMDQIVNIEQSHLGDDPLGSDAIAMLNNSCSALSQETTESRKCLLSSITSLSGRELSLTEDHRTAQQRYAAPVVDPAGGVESGFRAWSPDGLTSQEALYRQQVMRAQCTSDETRSRRAAAKSFASTGGLLINKASLDFCHGSLGWANGTAPSTQQIHSALKSTITQCTETLQSTPPERAFELEDCILRRGTTASPPATSSETEGDILDLLLKLKESHIQMTWMWVDQYKRTVRRLEDAARRSEAVFDTPRPAMESIMSRVSVCG